MDVITTTESTDFITPSLAEEFIKALINNPYIRYTIALILSILVSLGVFVILKKILKFIFKNIKGKLQNKNDEINHKIDLK